MLRFVFIILSEQVKNNIITEEWHKFGNKEMKIIIEYFLACILKKIYVGWAMPYIWQVSSYFSNDKTPCAFITVFEIATRPPARKGSVPRSSSTLLVNSNINYLN